VNDAFGPLSWNDRVGRWSGRTEVTPGHAIDVHVQAANDNPLPRAAIEHAGPAWVRLQATEPSVRATIAEQMADAHNEYCEPKDEVTPEQLASRIHLRSVLFESNGSVELCYDDGRLFGGHWIIVPIDREGRVGEPSEAG
jgi:hypothetical protein